MFGFSQKDKIEKLEKLVDKLARNAKEIGDVDYLGMVADTALIEIEVNDVGFTEGSYYEEDANTLCNYYFQKVDKDDHPLEAFAFLMPMHYFRTYEFGDGATHIRSKIRSFLEENRIKSGSYITSPHLNQIYGN